MSASEAHRSSTVPTKHWTALDDGRVRCDVCPRACALQDGQRGLCFVRAREGEGIVLTTYGRSSGFCMDPIEKKPLAHFLPGSAVLSFGTAGCNLSCKFCQNWDISKSRAFDTLATTGAPNAIAQAARAHGARSVAYTYNDPVVFLEYAIDVAKACHTEGIKNVAVTAGYVSDAPRAELFEHMDAANVDLKSFSESFYRNVAGGHLEPVLDTLRYLVHRTNVWTEITTLLIPGHNDSDEEITRLSEWVGRELGDDIPIHFSAFHPDYRMRDVPATPATTLTRARAIARGAGLKHVYTGNVHDAEGDTTYCASCGEAVIRRDWYRLLEYRLDHGGHCVGCGAALAGRFEGPPGTWGARRLPIEPQVFAAKR